MRQEASKLYPIVRAQHCYSVLGGLSGNAYDHDTAAIALLKRAITSLEEWAIRCPSSQLRERGKGYCHYYKLLYL